MTTLGKHCKSYQLRLFRKFPAWTENAGNARKMNKEIDGELVEVARVLDDSAYLYLQENFTVTDSIFIDENIIFSDVTEAWVDFCLQVLSVQFPYDDSQPIVEANQARQVHESVEQADGT